MGVDMKNKKTFLPPRIFVTILLGIFVGGSAYTVYVSRAHSYLSDDSETCVNCHIMAPQYATWNHSSHREVANCNDCHVPHTNFFEKYYFKAKDGLRHATIFTLRAEPQVIFIKEEGKEVVQENCIRCHNELIKDDKMIKKDLAFHSKRTDRKCWECHRETPHGRVNSLSSVPNAKVPVPTSPVPKWLSKMMSN
jgi:cytochrome c nitrite reductase small subunit